MREIEFRAWDVKEKAWFRCLLGLTFEQSPTGVYAIEVMSGLGDTEVFTYDRFKLVQYIGQKDKNKKKVFEGDIVKVPAGESGDNYYKECMAFVKYENDGFVLENPNNRWKFVEQDWWWNEVEIVGNIFENPNLIAEYYDNKEFESIVYNKI